MPSNTASVSPSHPKTRLNDRAGDLVFVALPGTEAIAIDRKLRNLTLRTPLTPQDAEQVSHYLTVASRWSLPVKRETLLRVRDAIKVSAMQAPHPALAKSATALWNYSGPVSRVTPLKIVPPIAEERLQRGLQYWRAAGAQPAPPESTKNLNAAVVAFTQAIENSNGYPTFQAFALVCRGEMNLVLGNRVEAAADARAAEALGSLNLAKIADVEGSILAHQTDLDDARRAVGLLTLVLDINAEQPGTVLYGGVLEYLDRAVAYIRLREYNSAISDALKVIALGKTAASGVGRTYGLQAFDHCVSGSA